MLNNRIKKLRLARGLSLDELAAKMGGVVTKQAISKYELGTAQPSNIVLNKLAAALNVRAVHLLNEPATTIEFIGYRRKSGLPKREQEKIESLLEYSLEQRFKLQSLTEEASESEIPVHQWKVKKLDDAESAADQIRENWNLGVAPISNLIGILESNRIHVIEIDVDHRFDGISAFASSKDGKKKKAAIVVSRLGLPGDRQRFNLAHELGHLVLNVLGKIDEEKAAHRFASAFLAPAITIRSVIGLQRSVIHSEELFLLKQRFGMSIQALLYRLKDLGIITESHYKKWCIDINRLGWKKHEPGEIPPEKPQWLRGQVLRLLTEEIITVSEAEEVLGASKELQIPLTLIEKKAFLSLPLEERRRIMKAQAEKLHDSFADDKDYKELLEWQGGDIVEY